jgi:hypothetical protein
MTSSRIARLLTAAATCIAVGLALASSAAAETVKPLGGVDINSTIGKADWERAALAGAKVGRREELEGNTPSLKETAKWAHEVGMKLDWISFLLKPTETNATSKKTLLQQYEELGENEKSAIALIELGNEWWPGGAGEKEAIARFGSGGKVIGEGFIAEAKVFREHEVPVPLGLQVQTSPIRAAQEWMEQLDTVNHTELKEALEPRKWLPSGNWLVSHPYDGKMTLPQEFPNQLLQEEATKKLLGSTTEASSSVTVEKEHAVAYQFTATGSGTVQTIDFHTGAAGSTTNSVLAAVARDNGGKPGESIDTSTVVGNYSAAETLHEITSVSAPVLAGTKYWLLLEPFNGNLSIKQGAGGGSQSRKTKGVVKGSISEASWEGEETHGPMFIEGIGPGVPSEFIYEDISGQNWGAQRWMKQQQLVKEWTGLTVPIALTEYGVAAAEGVANSVGSGGWPAVGEYMEAYWSFLHKVHTGEVTSAPTGLTPVVPLAIWYDEYAWHPTGEESFGILESEAGPGTAKEIGHPNEVGSVYKKFKVGIEGL